MNYTPDLVARIYFSPVSSSSLVGVRLCCSLTVLASAFRISSSALMQREQIYGCLLHFGAHVQKGMRTCALDNDRTARQLSYML